MAMFFSDAQLRCPKCGGTLMHRRTSGTYEQDTKDKTVWVFSPVSQEIVCSSCGAVAKTLDPLENTRGD